MKRNKGFTLIELLAVIVILAIIALIAVPTILGVVEKAKKGAAKASALMYTEAVELYLARQEIENFPVKLEANHTYQISNKTVEVSLIDLFVDKVKASEIYLNDVIKIKGEYPKSGYVVIGENYKVNEAKINVNGYEVTCNDSICNVTNGVKDETPIVVENISIDSDDELAMFSNILKYAQLNEKDNYIFNSTNEKVAVIDNEGNVTIKGNGETTISILKNKTAIKKYLLTVSAMAYKEDILNGADPVYKGNLIPVIIENDGTVKKANIKQEWYSYKDKKWANAVKLLNKSISYGDGDTIPQNNIESFFVWIPKYRYKLFNLGNYTSYNSSKPTTSIAQEIDIIFGDYMTSDEKDGECTTPMTSGATGNCNVGDYMTHPAFISMNTTGLWVGKYETGYKNASSIGAAEVNSSDSTKIIIKPNVYSWRKLTASNLFKASYNYDRDNNSHLIKNTEWGAVSYLSRSKYGINSEVNLNNNASYLTGYSSVVEQNTFPGISGKDSSVTVLYNTAIGYKASTTGNITGIYDMSGGANEYVAAYSGLGSSGFTNTTVANYGSSYFDVYLSDSSVNSYNNRILGDATGEMGPFYYYDENGTNQSHNSWYGDNSRFIESENPWFNRGGDWNSGHLSGQFYFNKRSGGVINYVGFRVVLSN